MGIFDTHAHYDDEAFDADRDELLKEIHENGIERIVDIACSMETSRKMAAFISRYDFMYGTIGAHPDDIYELTNNSIDELKKLSKQEGIVAVGEIGLDYHYEDIDKELQKKWFAVQLDMAAELKLPISVHSRDAAADTLDVMKAENAKDCGGVMHCFGYGVEMAREFLNMGYYIGVGGVVTFKNGRKLKEVVAFAPLDRIVVETDCPYLAPVPFRGKRNDSVKLKLVIEEIAAIKNVPADMVYEATFNNAVKLYGTKDVYEGKY